MRRQFIFMLLLAAGVALSLVFARAIWRTDVMRSAEREGLQIAERMIVARIYYADNAAKKAHDGGLPIRMDHRSDRTTLPFPATFTHDLADLYSAPSNVNVAYYSPLPFKGRTPHRFDRFQVAAWDALSQGFSNRYASLDEVDKAKLFRVAWPDRMNQKFCVDCHNGHPASPKRDWKLRDLRGIVEVSLDVTDRLEGIDRALFAIAMGAFALIVGAGFAAGRVEAKTAEGTAAWSKPKAPGPPPGPPARKPETTSFALMPPPLDDGGPDKDKPSEPPKPPKSG